MRTLAILLNVLLICTGLFLLVVVKSDDTFTLKLVLVYGLLFSAPIASLVALFFGDDHHANWINLYFKRKALEEQRRIDELSNR